MAKKLSYYVGGLSSEGWKKSKHKALMGRKEYMGDEKKEDQGKMKEGKGGKDNRKNIMKRVDTKPVPSKMC